MKKYGWKKIVLVLAAAVVLVVGVLGCKDGNKKGMITHELSDTEVFRIEELKCPLSVAKVFLTNYQNLYGTPYGINLWEHDFGEDKLEQYIKDLTVSQLAQIYSMELLANQQQVILTEEEIAFTEQAARTYYESLSEAEIAYMGINQSEMTELYRRYGLANKVYTHLIKGINPEVSDAEARVMEAYQIFVTERETADMVAAALLDGTDFLNLAGTYNEAEKMQVSFGKNDIPQKVADISFQLEPEQISDMIETPEGYYFIKCINNYNQELTDANKQVILVQRQKAAFEDVYENYVATLSSELNKKLWNSVEVNPSADIQTKSFFEVYEKYCNW